MSNKQPEIFEADQAPSQQPRKRSFFSRVGRRASFTEIPETREDSSSEPSAPEYRPKSSYAIAADATFEAIRDIRANPDLSDEEKAEQEKRVIDGLIESTR